jgi:hypothetical protein
MQACVCNCLNWKDLKIVKGHKMPRGTMAWTLTDVRSENPLQTLGRFLYIGESSLGPKGLVKLFCNEEFYLSCSPLKVNRRFGGTCRLHLQRWRVVQAWNQHEAGSKYSFAEDRACLSEMSADFERTTQPYIAENRTSDPMYAAMCGLLSSCCVLHSQPTMPPLGGGGLRDLSYTEILLSFLCDAV